MHIRTLINARVLTALTMFAIFAAMSIIALDYPPQARLMPLMVGVPGSILGFLQLLIEIRKSAVEGASALVTLDDESEYEQEHHDELPGAETRQDRDDRARARKLREQRWREIQMFAWVFAFFLGIIGFGFVYAAPPLVFCFLLFGWKESVATAIFGALGTWVVLYGLFQLLFELYLFEGLLTPMIAG